MRRRPSTQSPGVRRHEVGDDGQRRRHDHGGGGQRCLGRDHPARRQQSGDVDSLVRDEKIVCEAVPRRPRVSNHPSCKIIIHRSLSPGKHTVGYEVRLRTYKRLIIEHAGFNTVTPSGGSSCPNPTSVLSDSQFARLQPLLLGKVRGVPRADDRKVISGIIHVIRYGLMWRARPPATVPTRRSTTASRTGAGPVVFDRIFQAWPQKAPPLRPS